MHTGSIPGVTLPRPLIRGSDPRLVKLQQRKYLGTRRHSGQCPVLTIPPRSGALLVLGNLLCPEDRRPVQAGLRKGTDGVRAPWRGNSGSGKVRLRAGAKLLHAFNTRRFRMGEITQIAWCDA